MPKNLINAASYILITLTFSWSGFSPLVPVHTLYLSSQLVSIYVETDASCQAIVSDFCHDAQCLHTKIFSMMFTTQIKAAVLIWSFSANGTFLDG